MSFREGLVKSATLILVSEIGDKTFFIAAVMAMRHPQLTARSRCRPAPSLPSLTPRAPGARRRPGRAVGDDRAVCRDRHRRAQISPALTHHASTGLFFFFGLRTLYGATLGWGGGESELAEVEAELVKADSAAAAGKASGRAQPATLASPRVLRSAAKQQPAPSAPAAAAAAGTAPAARASGGGGGAAAAAGRLSPVLVQAFTLTFLAEWGDRSQIATVGLAATANPWGVTLGGCVGHAVCTGAAVAGGRRLASMISERAVGTLGGVLFLVFGLHSLLSGPPQLA